MPEAKSETTSTPTSTGSGGAASSQTASETVAPPEFRYAADPSVPDYLHGKTASEAANLTKQLYQQVVAQQSMVQQQQYQQQPQLFGQQPQYAAGDDPLAATRQWLTPEFQTRDAMMGAQARALAEMRYKDDFRRWGPEIDMALNQIPAAQRTPQVVDWIVSGVRGQHIEEISAERAKEHLDRLVQTGQLRPQGVDATGEAASSRVDLDKLPPRYSSMLRSLGVTASQIDEVLLKVYPQMPLPKAREKWLASASKGDVITDGRGFHFEGDNDG